MFRKVVVLSFLFALFAVAVYRPDATSRPGASPDDPAREDLSRIDYPSQEKIDWVPRFVRPEDTVQSMFGKNWPLVARFNRIDRRHIYPGMTIKVPTRIDDIRSYCPLPLVYEPARHHAKYILVSLTEQWLGAYEHGRLKFSMPVATGMDAKKTPTGLFRIDAHHRNHASSLYKTDDQSEQYPMDNAIRFFVGPDNVSYWIHARDLPGHPGSHGCIGVYDEGMQKRIYNFPSKPVLLDSEKLYKWALGEDEYNLDSGALEEMTDGPIVEVVGDNPHYFNHPLFAFLARK